MDLLVEFENMLFVVNVSRKIKKKRKASMAIRKLNELQSLNDNYLLDYRWIRVLLHSLSAI